MLVVNIFLVVTRCSRSEEEGMDQQYVLLTGEKKCKLVALPSHSTVCSIKFEHHPLIKAHVSTMNSSQFLAVLTTAGRVLAYSLPTLKVLFEAPLLETVDLKYIPLLFCKP